MRSLWYLVPVLLSACSAKAPSRSAEPAPSGIVQAEFDRSANVETPQPDLTTDVLPSITRSGTVNAEAMLLQRPTKASVILKTLAAGTVVQVLGSLDNADGRWLSVSIGDSQGWVRATQINP